MCLALLNWSVHDFEKFGAITFYSTASCSERDEWRTFRSEDGICATVDTKHEILDGRWAQADQSWVFSDIGVVCTLVRQIHCEAVILDFVVESSHLFEEVVLLLGDLIVCRCLLICDRARLIAWDAHTLSESRLVATEKEVHFLVEVLFVFYRFDEAVFDLYKAFLFNDKAAYCACLTKLSLWLACDRVL